MKARDVRVADPKDAVLIEQFLAMVHELRKVCQTAPGGQVLGQAEHLAVTRGHELIRRTLEGVLNEQAHEVEKKGPRPAAVFAAEFGAHRGRRERAILTAAGTVSLQRVYFVCRVCRMGTHPWDERLGVDGFVSPRARRLLCLAGASWSYDASAKFLQELCGLSVSDNTIRDVCQEEGAVMSRWQRDALEAHLPFRQAQGDIEFSTDGTSVNTWEGWREMRLGIFSKRLRGEAATAETWDDRKLPPPHVTRGVCSH